MKIHVLGAAGEVTGSAYLVETGRARVLIDFGLFQGSRRAERQNVVPPQLDVKRLDAVVLTHAHLDHTGRLPLLVKQGYRGPIFTHPATIGISGLILQDSARLQAGDVKRLNRKLERAGKKPVRPLYEGADVDRLSGLFRPVAYNERVPVAEGVAAMLVDAGHILGSASIELTLAAGDRRATVVFSGDIGPRGAPILRDPVRFKHADLVFMEATYGDRSHRPLVETLHELEQIVQAAVQRRGKILVPVFAIGRTQLLLYSLSGLFQNKVVPPFPVYLDSPMAIEATRIYAQHTELFDEEALALVKNGQLAEGLETVHFCETPEQSQALNDVPGPCLIMAGAGMCNGGRILHHLRHNLYRPETTVIIVGYQSEGSLGRQLVDRKQAVKIFGERIAVKASVHTLGGLSAHAGQNELLQWADAMVLSKPRIVLTHAEERGRQPLKQILERAYRSKVECPLLGDVIELS
ncbi:MAG: MBL fold metallo-hydrolase [Gemmataceae bacterium]